MTTLQFVSRPAMESIFIGLAREAVLEAERHEPNISGSVEAHVQMQHRSITALVTAVQALEAFINVEAENRLSGSLWKSVERLGIVSKWLIVTRLITGKEWERDRQPFQDFQQLIKQRNDLVHYKQKYTAGDQAFQKNDFTGTLARRYFTAACGMIEGFFEKAGEEVPPHVQPGTLTRGFTMVIPTGENQNERKNQSE